MVVHLVQRRDRAGLVTKTWKRRDCDNFCAWTPDPGSVFVLFLELTAGVRYDTTIDWVGNAILLL